MLFENLLRFEDDNTVTTKDIQAIADWLNTKKSQHENCFQTCTRIDADFTGVPAVVDLAAMRAAIVRMGGNAIRFLLCLLLISNRSLRYGR